MVFSSFYYVLVLALSILFVLIILPSVIQVARVKNLFDDNALLRKEHRFGIPRLGGVAIFISTVLTSLFVIAKTAIHLPMYELYAAGTILFLVGLKDDLLGMHCFTKLVAQSFVSLIITVPGNIRIDDMQGVLNMHQLSYPQSVVFSMLLIMFLINAFNLIDGIDGLAGTLGIIACSTFAYYFMLAGETSLAAMALAVAGSLIGFLAYNYSPAQIFMGDTGSLLLGLTSAVFAIKFIAVNEVSNNIHAAPAFAVAVLIVPIFDTLSVIVIRIAHKKSPFKPDRNHIHHRMLRLGLSHIQSTSILGMANVVFIGLALLFRDADSQLLLLFFAGLILMLNGVVNFLLRAKTKMLFPLGNLIS